MPNLDQIRELVIRELDIADLPAEEQDKIISRVGELIVKAVSIAIFSRLPVSVKPEYDRMEAEGDREGIEKLVASQIPDLDIVVDNAMKDTIEDYKKILATM